jgi:hypothetical protein
MTQQEWLAEVARRTVLDEDDKTVAYPDPLSPRAKTGSGSGDPWTIGIGHIGPEVHEGLVWTQAQVEAQFASDLPKYVAEARASLDPGIFDFLSDARRFVIFDLCYTMGSGPDGWGGFHATHQIIAQAELLKNQGRLVQAHGLFVQAGERLIASTWYGQTGDRAKRDVAMIRSGDWVRADGDGSDGGA